MSRFHRSVREIPLSSIRLSQREETGQTSRDYGLLPARTRQTPAQRCIGPAHVLFCWPSQARAAPRR